MRTLITAAVLAVVAGCSPAPQSPPTAVVPPEADLKSSCFTVHDKFAANEAQARVWYADKWILVTGLLGPVTRTDTGYSVPLLEMGEVCVVCLFDPSQEQSVATLPRPGNRVHIIGRVFEVRHGAGLFQNTLVAFAPCDIR